MDNYKTKSIYYKKTRLALFMSAILKEPLFCMYNLTAFILRKDLDASVFHLAILTMIRPTMSFLSYYWGSNLSNRQDKLKSNFLWAGFLSCVLFLFFPFINSIWFVILANAFYIMFHRASTPAWMETIKLNIEPENREKLFSWASTIGYLEGAILAIAIGYFLKKNIHMYKNLYFFAALIALINVLVLFEIPINFKKSKIKNIKKPFKNSLSQPIKDSINLIKSRPDFALFQWGFMLCGFGLMLIQPIIPIFCADKLNLSYSEFAIALLVFKALGYVISSPIWGRFMSKISIMKLSALVFLLVFFFIFLLGFSSFNIIWLYFSFFIYGIASAGSHLLWNLSGPIFAKDESSSQYTSVNVVMVAIRGSIAPILGSFLAIFLSPIIILFIGSFFCIYASYKLIKNKLFLIKENKIN